MAGLTGKAAVLKAYGGPEVLEVVTDFPAPHRKTGEVLVKLVSTSVNPVDIYVRNGKYPITLPKILGGDLAGVVVEADETSKYKKGDKVYAMSSSWGNAEGTYSEYTVAEESWLAAIPHKLPIEEAAGLPLVGLTAYQALKDAEPKAGQRVLVTAAAGGVGHIAVQLAKAWGLYVVGTAGPDNLAYLKEIRCDEVVNYREQDVLELFKENPFDIVLDVIGGDLQRSAGEILKPDGVYSHVLNRNTNNDDLEAKKTGCLKTVTTFVKPNGKQLEEISKLVEEGKGKPTTANTFVLQRAGARGHLYSVNIVKLYVQKTFPIEELAAAHALVETWHVRGKVVLTF